MKVYVGFHIHTDANIFECVFFFFVCGRVCVRVGDAQSCFCVCILSSSEVPLLVGGAWEFGNMQGKHYY